MRLLAVLAAALVLGGLTSYAQGALPDALASLANSPSGWTILTVLVVVAVRPSLTYGALLGAVAFVALVVGYTIASDFRGYTYRPLEWGAIGVLAGPFVGAAAASLPRRDTWAGLGAGVLGGVLVSDGIYGLTVVDDTTSPVYWTAVLVLGALLVVGVGARLRALVPAAALVGAFVATTAFLTAAYRVLNG